MKKVIRIVTGILFFALGTFFAGAAVSVWLQGTALHIGFGALCGSLAFFIAGFMTVGEDGWHEVADFLLSMWWL